MAQATPVFEGAGITRKRRGSVTELDGGSDKAKFSNLCSIGIFKQAKWFLKTYWSRDPIKIGENMEVAEHVYAAAKEMKRRAHGANDLEQLKAHHFLEKVDGAITYTDFKKKFNDLDLDFNNRLSLTEYLVYKYDLGSMEHISVIVNSKQVVVAGLADAEAEVERCQYEFERAMEARADVEAIMKQIEDMSAKHAARAERLQKSVDKHEGKPVKQNIQRKKLEVHNNNHPVDNKMELTQKAAVRKAKKAAKRFEMELLQAQDKVEDIKNSGVTAHAVLWWMERSLQDMEKTMSKKAFAKKQAKLAAKKAAADVK